MVKGKLDTELITRLEQLEQSLFGGKLEELVSKEKANTVELFEDKLEKATFLIALELALEGKVGVTSALLAEKTHKTKNTVNVRLERLYYKRLIQKQQIGNAVLYYVPLYALLLRAVTGELIAVKKEHNEKLEDVADESLAKDLWGKYLRNANLVLKRSKEYFTAVREPEGTMLNLKKELIG